MRGSILNIVPPSPPFWMHQLPCPDHTETFRLTLTVQLLGIMLRNRCWLTIFSHYHSLQAASRLHRRIFNYFGKVMFVTSKMIFFKSVFLKNKYS